MQEIPGNWRGGAIVDLPGTGGTDLFSKASKAEFPALGIGFQPVKPGTTLESWAAAEQAPPDFNGCKAGALESITVAGQPALMQAVQCSDHVHLNVFLVVGKQGVIIGWQGRQAMSAATASLMSILPTLKLP
jgi:hypothetical protein